MEFDRAVVVAAILLAGVAAAAGTLWSNDAIASGPAWAAPPVPASPRQARPFRHAAHTRLACAGCHPTGARHRTPRVWTPADCAACHHDSERAYSCTSCHAPSAIVGPRTVTASMSLTVWSEPRVRDLPFDHQTHSARACGECHGPDVTRDPRTACTTCHVEHHVPEANCAGCHRPTEPGVHARPVHLSCTGSGCHSRDESERPPLSRSLCLLCHTAQTDHEPGSTCHVCHQIPASTVPRPGGG